MLLISGNSYLNIKNEYTVEKTCGVCGHPELKVTGKDWYYHWYWIPVWPIGREFFLSCKECESILAHNHEINAFVPNVTNNDIPASMFLHTFTVLIGVGFLAAFVWPLF